MTQYYGPVPSNEEKRRGTQLSAYEMAMDIERLSGRDVSSIISAAIGSRNWTSIPEEERQELVLGVWRKMALNTKRQKKANGAPSESIAAFFGKRASL